MCSIIPASQKDWLIFMRAHELFERVIMYLLQVSDFLQRVSDFSERINDCLERVDEFLERVSDLHLRVHVYYPLSAPCKK